MKIKRLLVKLLQCLMLFFMAIILYICITGTAHNIVWYKELIVTTGFLAIIFLFCLVLKRARVFIQRHEKMLLSAFVLLNCFALYMVSCGSRNVPMYDYADIYRSAYAYAYGGEVNWHYFALWSNNFSLFLLLSLVMKLCALIRISDPFYVLLGINVVLTIWGGICIYRLIKQQTGDVVWAFIGLFLYSAFLPLWSGTNYFYTDSVSIAFGVWAVWELVGRQRTRRRCLFAGVLWGIGFSIKATVGISLVAVVIVSLLTKGKAAVRQVWLALPAFILCIGVLSGIRAQFPCHALEEQNKMPLTYWLALGIHNNGSYPENVEFAVECMNTPGRQQKHELACSYISEHCADFWSVNHIISKARYNFASGKMGASEFNQNSGTLMYELMNDYGKYGGYSTMITSGYFYALLLFGMAGQLLLICKSGGSEQKNDFLFEVSQFTVFGLFFFLMLWESNNRQLYNHIPWYAIYAVGGLYGIMERLPENEKIRRA